MAVIFGTTGSTNVATSFSHSSTNDTKIHSPGNKFKQQLGFVQQATQAESKSTAQATKLEEESLTEKTPDYVEKIIEELMSLLNEKQSNQVTSNIDLSVLKKLLTENAPPLLEQLGGKKLEGQHPHLQALQSLIDRIETVLGEKGLSFSQSDLQQAILRAAFQRYKTSENNEEALELKTSVAKPVIYSMDQFNPFFSQVSKAEQLFLTVKTNSGTMDLEQFIEKFTQTLGNSSLVKNPNGTRLLIKLYPEQLGALRIELLQQNGVLTAKIVSATQAVKELLEQNSHQLKQAFGQQQLLVEKIDITSPESKQQLFEKGTHQQEQKQERKQDQEEERAFEEEILSFSGILENLEKEV